MKGVGGAPLHSSCEEYLRHTISMMEEKDNHQISNQAFGTLLQTLAQPGAFPFSFADREMITLKQTHASAVLLTNNYAYKLKKPRKYGFDYSTPQLRRKCCKQEVILNARLAPHVYLGVAPVVAYPDNRFCFGETLQLDDVPSPGSTYSGEIMGTVVDYAVVMRRLPDEATLSAHVAAGAADAALMSEIAHVVASFHEKAEADEHVAAFGHPNIIRSNWEMVFQQVKPYIGRVLDAGTYQAIVNYAQCFLEAHRELLERRVQEKRIRDCHGDLQLQHIYIFPRAGSSEHEFKIIDCIDFSDRFRCGDVAGEVAFLKMDMDSEGREDLARAFVTAYVQETNDQDLYQLLPFYACYRACVRGKAFAFQLDQPEVSAPLLDLAHERATRLFTLARSYIDTSSV